MLEYFIRKIWITLASRVVFPKLENKPKQSVKRVSKCLTLMLMGACRLQIIELPISISDHWLSFYRFGLLTCRLGPMFAVARPFWPHVYPNNLAISVTSLLDSQQASRTQLQCQCHSNDCALHA